MKPRFWLRGVLAFTCLLAFGTLRATEKAERIDDTAREVVVVELFTSQGCSSCPPADYFLGELANEPGVLALSHHVDYWDRLGWEDPYATARAGERQRRYADAFKLRSIYTPQMVIDGRFQTVGSSESSVRAHIIASRSRFMARATFTVTRDAGGLSVTVRRAENAPARARVILAEYLPVARTRVTDGENEGRTLEEHNIVTGWTVLGEVTGDEETFTLPAGGFAGGRGYAVLAQAPDAGPILGARKLATGPAAARD
jgi:hypothetical protein